MSEAEHEDAEHDARELDRLVRFSTRPGRAFGLALATYADVAVAEEQRALASERVDRRVVEVELGARGGGLVAALAEFARDHDVVFLVGLDALVYEFDGQGPVSRALAELNLRRDELPELLDARVVVWIASEAYPRLAAIAWDLLEVMLTRFEFRSVREREVARAELPGLGLAWMQLGPGVDRGEIELQARSLADTAARETGQGAADAAASAGRLYAGLGRFDEAARLLVQAADEYEALGSVAAVEQRRRLAEVFDLAGDQAQARVAIEKALELIDATLRECEEEQERRELERQYIGCLWVLGMLQLKEGGRSLPSGAVEISDRELFVRWQGGDRKAGSELLERHFSRLRSYFVILCGDRAANDLVQETFVRIIHEIPEFGASKSFLAHLFTHARQVAREHLRFASEEEHARPLSGAERGGTVFVDRGLPQHALNSLLDALRTLPLKSEELIELHYLHGFSVAELAEILELPPLTVAQHLNHARLMLAMRFSDLVSPSDPASGWQVDAMLRALRDATD